MRDEGRQESGVWIMKTGNSPVFLHPSSFILFFHRVSGVFPGSDSAGQRVDSLITHLLQIVGGKGGAESTAAIQDDFRFFVRYCFFNIPLDDPTTEMLSSLSMSLIPFVVFTHVYKV